MFIPNRPINIAIYIKMFPRPSHKREDTYLSLFMKLFWSATEVICSTRSQVFQVPAFCWTSIRRENKQIPIPELNIKIAS